MRKAEMIKQVLGYSFLFYAALWAMDTSGQTGFWGILSGWVFYRKMRPYLAIMWNGVRWFAERKMWEDEMRCRLNDICETVRELKEASRP